MQQPTTRYQPTGRFTQPDDPATELGQRIAIHFSRRQWEICREILERAIAGAAATAATLADPLDAHVSALGLQVIIINMLEQSGIATVRDLGQTSRATLLLIPNFGTRRIEEVCNAVTNYLAEHGIARRS